MARSLSDLPPKQQWIVASLLSVAVVVIYLVQFYRPSTAEFRRMEREISDLRAEVREVQVVASDLPGLAADLDALQQQLSVMAHILPADYETAELLRGVGTLAAQSNLSIRDLEFKSPVPYDFYAESPIELELTGSYHDLGPSSIG